MRHSARLAAAACSVGLVSCLALAGCGSASEPSPPSGVDELVIPSPSLDPADFVEGVDNPWLPLVPGSEWHYRATTAVEPGTITVTVLDETREIQGVTATVVQEVVRDREGEVTEDTVTWLAQDAEGNVWTLGEEGLWEAGVDGAEAGLAMPARPRVGDGYRTAYLEGAVEDRAEVVDLEGSASVPYGDLTGLLEIENSTPLEPGVLERKVYARDLGLVRDVTVDGGDELVELVSFVRSSSPQCPDGHCGNDDLALIRRPADGPASAPQGAASSHPAGAPEEQPASAGAPAAGPGSTAGSSGPTASRPG